MSPKKVYVLLESNGYVDSCVHRACCSISVFTTKELAEKASDEQIKRFVTDYYEGCDKSENEIAQAIANAVKYRNFLDYDQLVEWTITETIITEE